MDGSSAGHTQKHGLFFAGGSMEVDSESDDNRPVPFNYPRPRAENEWIFKSENALQASLHMHSRLPHPLDAGARAASGGVPKSVHFSPKTEHAPTCEKRTEGDGGREGPASPDSHGGEGDGEEGDGRKNRSRKNSREFKRDKPCTHAGCGRSYSTENSLRNHIRIKHAFRPRPRTKSAGGEAPIAPLPPSAPRVAYSPIVRAASCPALPAMAIDPTGPARHPYASTGPPVPTLPLPTPHSMAPPTPSTFVRSPAVSIQPYQLPNTSPASVDFAPATLGDTNRVGSVYALVKNPRALGPGVPMLVGDTQGLEGGHVAHRRAQAHLQQLAALQDQIEFTAHRLPHTDPMQAPRPFPRAPMRRPSAPALGALSTPNLHNPTPPFPGRVLMPMSSPLPAGQQRRGGGLLELDDVMGLMGGDVNMDEAVSHILDELKHLVGDSRPT